MMAPASRRGVSEAEGLRRIRLAERRRLSRILHDEVGPALCAAGLAAEMLRETLPSPAAAQLELLDRLGRALESAVETVRLLSHEASPELAGRRGLSGALELLARACGAALRIESEPQLAPAEAAALCELVRDALVGAESSPAEIVLTARGVRIRAAGLGDAGLLAALEPAARGAGFAILAQPAAEAVIIEIPCGGTR
jgi:signal transduction histidine kinase